MLSVGHGVIRVFFGDKIPVADGVRIVAEQNTVATALRFRLLIPFLPDAVPMPGDRALRRAVRNIDSIMLPLVRAERSRDDDPASVRKTIDYAVHLNTFGAQFTIATPYPGTPWYDALRSGPSQVTFDEDFENFNQYRLVYSHPKLTAGELHRLKSDAYRRYYFRPGYILKYLRRVFTDF